MLYILRASTIFMFLFPIVFQPALPRPIVIILFMIDMVLLIKTAEEEERKERRDIGTGQQSGRRNASEPFGHNPRVGREPRRTDANTSFSVDWHSN